jgi:thiamine monophosphate kinase
LGREPLTFALEGGEDYALLVSGPKRARPRGGLVIGEVTKGRGALLRGSRGVVPLAGGFDHFG